MSLGTSNRDGGKTSESGHLRALAKMVSGDVLEGLSVSQRGAGANMSVDVAVGDALIRRSDGSYAHPVFNDAVYNQVISAADGSNPRRDIIVIYVDYGQTPSTAVSNNTNGVVKIKVVNGTPAGSPVDPNAAAIQSSVGAGNPYSILARVRVPAGQTSINNSLIDDLRSLIRPKNIDTNSIPDKAVTYAKIDLSTLPKIKAIDTSTTTISNTSGTTADLPITSAEINVGSLFSLSSNSITVSEAGIYLIFGEARCTDVENFFATITQNGSLISQLSFAGKTSTSRGYQVSQGQTLRSLSASDVIKLRYENRSFATSCFFKALTIIRIG